MVKMLVFDRRLVSALWVLVAYLLVLYAAIRWDIRRPIAIPAATSVSPIPRRSTSVISQRPDSP